MSRMGNESLLMWRALSWRALGALKSLLMDGIMGPGVSHIEGSYGFCRFFE